MQDSPARATRSRHGLSQSEQVPATLCITEKWIRKRLNLQLDSLGQFTGIWKPIATDVYQHFSFNKIKSYLSSYILWPDFSVMVLIIAFLSLVARAHSKKEGLMTSLKSGNKI